MTIGLCWRGRYIQKQKLAAAEMQLLRAYGPPNRPYALEPPRHSRVSAAYKTPMKGGPNGIVNGGGGIGPPSPGKLMAGATIFVLP